MTHIGNRRTLRTKPLLLAVIVGAALLLTACGGGSDENSPASESDYRGTRLKSPAPDFRLTDQHGQPAALSDFRGKVVVLAFMDSRCDETCPLTAAHLRQTYWNLGPDAEGVQFLGANVNRDFNRVEDVKEFTGQQPLKDIPGWRFLTGPFEELKPVWDAYSIDVYKNEPEEEDYEHTPGVFVIDREGNLAWYVSTPLIEEGLVGEWQGPSLSELLTAHVRDLL